ncbi:hypothetical protein CASFOL_030259 [Castilleja foliolosa]|uniref:SHSP domain-containing protein n=1 Tax=Castilleja foliolosa TaxID=1961234 RepID=A0ABD3C7E6_9LAMI
MKFTKIHMDIEPLLSDVVHEEDCDTILLHLPGFRKEQLRVHLARSGVLMKISGMLGDNKWSLFQKDFPVPVNCDTTKITAKFEDGILYVRLPKDIVHDKKPTQISPETSPKTNHDKSTPDKPVPNQEVVDRSSDDTPGTTAGADKREKVQSGAELAKKGTFDIAKLLEETKLKVIMRKKMTRGVALFAFVLGMCINKQQAWFS